MPHPAILGVAVPEPQEVPGEPHALGGPSLAETQHPKTGASLTGSEPGGQGIWMQAAPDASSELLGQDLRAQWQPGNPRISRTFCVPCYLHQGDIW